MQLNYCYDRHLCVYVLVGAAQVFFIVAAASNAWHQYDLKRVNTFC